MTENQEFIGSIELSTSSVQAVRKRFDLWRGALERVVGAGVRRPVASAGSSRKRCSKQIRPAPFAANASIMWMNAAVDHIEQYWTGGKTWRIGSATGRVRERKITRASHSEPEVDPLHRQRGSDKAVGSIQGASARRKK
jgi:hypothetical protein